MISLTLVVGMDDGHDLVVRTIREHAGALLRTARRDSLCLDDAHDAYQRGLEIFLRRAPTLDPATAVKWLHVVVRNEAKAVRTMRLELVGSEEANLDAHRAERQTEIDERAVQGDRMARSAEALARLKPQEVTALWLKAQGLSYAEIAERQNWTATKVNRCLVEGRRAFLRRYAGIEAGEECRRWAPVVVALVDGEATADQLSAARPHLRRCSSCRATIRELRIAGPRLDGILPLPPALPLCGAAGLAGSAGAGAGGLGGAAATAALAGSAGAGALGPVAPGSGRAALVAQAVAALHERAVGWVLRLQGAAEAAAGTKAAAVAASAAVLAGGGAATIHEVQRRPDLARTSALRAGTHDGPARAAGPPAAAVALRVSTAPGSRAPSTSAAVADVGSVKATSPSPVPEFSTVSAEFGTVSAEFRAAGGPQRLAEFRAAAARAGTESAGAIASGAASAEFRAASAGAPRTPRRLAPTTRAGGVASGPSGSPGGADGSENEFSSRSVVEGARGSASTRGGLAGGSTEEEFGVG